MPIIAASPYGALMVDITPLEQRGQMGSFLAVAATLGAILLNVVAGLLWVRHQSAVFLFAAVGVVLAYGITFFTVAEPPVARATPPIPTTPLRYLGDVLRYRDATRFVGAQCLANLGAGGALPFVTLFLTKSLGVSGGTAFFLVLVLVAATAIGAIPAGLLADRLGKKPVMIAGLALDALGALVGSQVHSVARAIPALILVGLGNAGSDTLGLPLLSELIPARRTAEFIGINAFISSLALPIGAFCAGTLVDSALPSTYRNTFLWAGILATSAAIATLTVRPARARRSGCRGRAGPPLTAGGSVAHHLVPPTRPRRCVAWKMRRQEYG
jgi:MFS family permease